MNAMTEFNTGTVSLFKYSHFTAWLLLTTVGTIIVPQEERERHRETKLMTYVLTEQL